LSKEHSPWKHGLYHIGAMPCNKCPWQDCKYRRKDQNCIIKLQATENLDTIPKVQEAVILLTGQEIVRLLTRLRITLQHGELKLNVHGRVLGHAVHFLKILERFQTERGTVVGKTVAQQLAQLRKESKNEEENRINLYLACRINFN